MSGLGRPRSQSNASQLSNALSLASFESTDGLGLHNPSMGIPATGNSSGIGGAESSQRRHSYQQRSIDLKEIDEIKRYEDFSTIDWVQDAARENLKRRLKIKRLRERTTKLRRIDREMGIGHDSDGFFRQRLSFRSRFLVGLYDSFSAAQAWMVLTLIGIVLGVLAGSVNIITKWLVDLRTGHCSLGLYLNKDFCCPGGQETCPEWKEWTGFMITDYFVYILFSVVYAFIAAYLVKFYAPYAAGSGISEIKCIIAGFVMNGFLEFPTLATKCLTLPLTIASGFSVGKEGPSVHYAACVGNVIGNMFSKYRNNMSKMREILSACTAAGVAVAFGSPMGGVLFSIEEVSSTFQIKTMWRSYFCALVSTIVLAGVNAFRTGQIVIFSVSYDYDWHFFEIPFFMIIGLFGGFFGIFLSKWNLRAQGFRKKYLAKYALQEVAFLATITAAICYFNPILRLDMTESMQLLFRECENGHEDHVVCDPNRRTHVILMLLCAIVIRTALVIVSYGAKVPAGIFVPSLAIGAIFGRIVGTIVQAIHDSSRGIVKNGGSSGGFSGNSTEALTGFLADRAVEYVSTSYSTFFAACPPEGPCITPGTYAFLGAAAALSGVLNITVTVVIIMYEITGALNYIVPTMIVVGVTQAVNSKWGKGSLTDQSIWFNGYPFMDTKEQHRFNAPVSKAMAKKLIVLPARGMALSKLEHILKTTSHRGFPIVDDFKSKFLLGYIGRSELQYVIDIKRSEGNISPNAKCYFAKAPAPGNASSGDGPAGTISDSPTLDRHVDRLHDEDLLNEGNYHENASTLIFTASDNPSSNDLGAHGSLSDIISISFEKYVNFTPISVRPSSPLETVMEIFSQLGPGVVLVDDFGRLCGLMSRKDILRYQFRVEHTYSPGARERELNKTAAQEVDAKIWNLIAKACAFIYTKLTRVLPRSWLPEFQLKTAEGTDVLEAFSTYRNRQHGYSNLNISVDDDGDINDHGVREEPDWHEEAQTPGQAADRRGEAPLQNFSLM